MNEYEWFWLCTIKGLYDRQRKVLLQFFETPEQIRRAKKEELENIPFLTPPKVQIILRHQKEFDPEKQYHMYERRGIQFISHSHKRFPKRLKAIYDYPVGLFYIGKIPAQEEPVLAVIGARMCSAYGRHLAHTLSEALAQNGISVVSGMACGIDSNAQESCIKAGGNSYAVLGSGVDVCYPQENRRLYEKLKTSGGLISEYPPGTPALPAHFPMRNRIISGLCDRVVVVEARKRSGTLITADLALEQGRDVYAFPGRVDDVLSGGCNRLIRQGAGVITDIESFLEEIGCVSQKSAKEKNCKFTLASSEKLVYSCLDSQSKSLEDICSAVNLPVNQIMSALMTLQMKGIVAESAKNYYAKVR